MGIKVDEMKIGIDSCQRLDDGIGSPSVRRRSLPVSYYPQNSLNRLLDHFKGGFDIAHRQFQVTDVSGLETSQVQILIGEYHSIPMESTLIAFPANRVPGRNEVVASSGAPKMTTSASLYLSGNLKRKIDFLKLIVFTFPFDPVFINDLDVAIVKFTVNDSPFFQVVFDIVDDFFRDDFTGDDKECPEDRS